MSFRPLFASADILFRSHPTQLKIHAENKHSKVSCIAMLVR